MQKTRTALHFDAFRVFFKSAAIFAAATLRSDARRRSSANICAKCAYSLADLDALHALAKKNAQPWINHQKQSLQIPPGFARPMLIVSPGARSGVGKADIEIDR